MKNTNLLKSKLTFTFMTTVMALFLIAMVPSTNYKVLAAGEKASEASARTINVTGEGEVSAVPDIAYVSLGITTEKTSVVEAQKNNSDTMNKIIDGIKKSGVASEDIKTAKYDISPKYNYEDKTGNRTLVGYTVTSILNVTVKNTSSVGSIIDTAIANGANTSNGVTFGVSDYQKYYNMALKNAISNAKSKAQVIGSCIDVKLSNPTKITENSRGVPTEYPVLYNSAGKSSSREDSMSVEVGTYKINANVSLVYEY